MESPAALRGETRICHVTRELQHSKKCRSFSFISSGLCCKTFFIIPKRVRSLSAYFTRDQFDIRIFWSGLIPVTAVGVICLFISQRVFLY